MYSSAQSLKAYRVTDDALTVTAEAADTVNVPASVNTGTVATDNPPMIVSPRVTAVIRFSREAVKCLIKIPPFLSNTS